MKQTLSPKNNRALTTRIVAFTLVAAIGGTLAVAPSVAAREFNMFDKVREVLGDKQTQLQVPHRNDNTRLQQVIQKASQEIDRRQQSLQRLTTKINSAVTLADTDKAALTAEIALLSGRLSDLKTQLAGVQNVNDARELVRSIKSEYNAYALIMPKLHIVKLADDVVATDDKLLDLAGKLQLRINEAKESGNNVDEFETKLSSLLTHAGDAQMTAKEVKAGAIAIAYSDNKDNRTTLYNLYQLLKSARDENKAAYADARSIVQALKTQ